MRMFSIIITLIFANASFAEMNPATIQTTETETPRVTALEVSRITAEEAVVSFELRQANVHVYIVVHAESSSNVVGHEFVVGEANGPVHVAWRARNLVPDTRYTVTVHTSPEDKDAVDMKFSTASGAKVGRSVVSGGSFLAEYTAPDEYMIASRSDGYVRCMMRSRIDDVNHMPIDSEGITRLFAWNASNKGFAGSIPLWIGIEIQPDGLYMTALYAVRSPVPHVIRPLPPKKG